MPSSETLAIVAATFLGPVAAVLITLWREAVREKRNRRLYVFRTLMATRKIPISNEHVNAINLVEVDFYGCKNVEAAWKDYSKHLNDQTKTENEAWREEKEKLLSKLLSEIADVMGFRVPAIDIFRGGYAPKGWQHRDNRLMTGLEYINDLYEGTRGVKVIIVPPPPSSAQSAQPAPTVPPKK